MMSRARIASSECGRAFLRLARIESARTKAREETTIKRRAGESKRRARVRSVELGANDRRDIVGVRAMMARKTVNRGGDAAAAGVREHTIFPRR